MQQSRPPLPVVPPQVPAHSPDFRTWGNSVGAFDLLQSRSSSNDPEQADPFFVVNRDNGVDTVTEILPRPRISRVGTKSRPFRLLSGREIQLSEDDLRVTGISKRYPPGDVYRVGTFYRIGDTNIGQSDYELVFLDDSDPVSYSLTIRQRSDDRYQGYDLLP